MENYLINGFNNGRDALDGVGGMPGPIQLMEKEYKKWIISSVEKLAEKKTFQEWLRMNKK